VARGAFSEREPFTESKLANPNDPSFLAATLGANMRAVTIATDAVSGIAGYVFPGDHVDVFITHNIPSEEKNRQLKGFARGGDKPEYTEILVPNARVLAVNVRPATNKELTVNTPTSITLEVDTDHAQALRLAEKVGTLSLALRPLKDKEVDDSAEPARAVTLTKATVSMQNSVEGVRIVRGAGDKETQMMQALPTSGGEASEPVDAVRN
jgi:pilus assembly protein CpaB